jgi:hypothetical protein
MYDRYYRRRMQKLEKIETMQDFEKAQQPMNAFHELIGPDPQNGEEALMQRECGKGRAAYVKDLDIDRLPRTPESWRIASDDIMMPRNVGDLDAAMTWLLPRGTGVEVRTNGRLYVHFAERPDTGDLLVHLLNAEGPDRRARADVTIEVDSVSSISSVSYDDEATGFAERKEIWKSKGNRVSVPVKDIRIHRTVIVRP